MQFQRCPKISADTGIRTVFPRETLEKTIPLLSKMGMDPLEDITGIDNIGIPVFSIYRERTAKGTFGDYNGKGPTVEQAKASAVMEAVERYSAEQKDSDEIVYGTIAQAQDNGPTVDPVDLILPLRVLDYVDSAEIAWVTGSDLFSGQETWVPACAAFYPYYPSSDLQLFRFHTNGLASGNTIEEAVLHALFELIERDAWSVAESRDYANADVIIDDENSVAAQLLRKFNENGVEIHLKDLTSDIGIPTIGAASDDTSTRDPELLTIGVGTHLNPNIAAVRALTEVAQSRTTHKHGLKVNAKLQKITKEMGYDRVKAMNGVWYADCEKKVRLSDMKDLSTPYVLDDIEVVLGDLMGCGFRQVIAVDLTRPDIGIPTVRMIVPGLEVATMDSEREGMRLFGKWP
ncbi:MAG: YcaO-related McrA-glycine thioamidation protein [Candidatus Methanomethylophilaceae archaeon]